MTKAERAARAAAIVEIERIIVENAQLIGQEPELGVRFLAKGWIRIQLRKDGKWIRGNERDYPGIDHALAAAREANARARLVATKLESGIPLGAALRESFTEAPVWSLVPRP